jgi:hypothetical protein
MMCDRVFVLFLILVPCCDTLHKRNHLLYPSSLLSRAYLSPCIERGHARCLSEARFSVQKAEAPSLFALVGAGWRGLVTLPREKAGAQATNMPEL